MGEYRFFHSIEVRYGDIDAQRHVNNSRHFTYMEQARTKYIKALGFWEGSDFDTIGIILAEQSCRYLSPIQLERDIKSRGSHRASRGEKHRDLILDTGRSNRRRTGCWVGNIGCI